jgi:hypothetical protein
MYIGSIQCASHYTSSTKIYFYNNIIHIIKPQQHIYVFTDLTSTT